MCRTFRITLSLIALVAVPCAILAQSKPFGALPPTGFKFPGNWECAGAFGNGKTHRATFSGAQVLDDKWIELTERDVEPATEYLAKYLIGYDAQQDRLIEFDANNFGAAVYSSQQGWQGGVLTMTSVVFSGLGETKPGKAKVPYVANRFVYSIVTDDSFSVDWQVEKTTASEWVQSDHLSCKRVVTRSKNS